MTDLTSSAPRRIYHCRRCGYRLRFNAPRCGDCYTKTPIYNHSAFWWSLLAAGLCVLGLGLLTLV